MKKMMAFYVFLLALAVFLAGCGSGGGSTASGGFNQAQQKSARTRDLAPTVNSTAQSPVTMGITALGINLVNAVSSGNTVVAPFSAAMTLAKLRAGAVGATRDGLSTFLHVNGLTTPIEPVFNTLDLAVTTRLTKATLALSDSTAGAAGWLQPGYGYLLSYLDELAVDFGLKPGLGDFNSKLTNARGDISTWTGAVTGGITDSIGGNDTRLVLGDAVRLNDAWAVPFDPAQSVIGVFQKSLHGGDQCIFMRQSITLPYVTGPVYTALGIPLKSGLQFLVVMPALGQITQFATALTPQLVEQMVAAMTPTQIDLALPQFSIIRFSTLQLGLAAVKGTADFSGVDKTNDLFVSTTSHQVKINVAEAGIQAQGATLIALDDRDPTTWGCTGIGCITLGSVGNNVFYPPPAQGDVLARPFLFFVRDPATGVILFQGQVMNVGNSVSLGSSKGTLLIS